MRGQQQQHPRTATSGLRVRQCGWGLDRLRCLLGPVGLQQTRGPAWGTWGQHCSWESSRASCWDRGKKTSGSEQQPARPEPGLSPEPGAEAPQWHHSGTTPPSRAAPAARPTSRRRGGAISDFVTNARRSPAPLQQDPLIFKLRTLYPVPLAFWTREIEASLARPARETAEPP